MNIQIDNSVYRSDLETTILASFPSKSLNYTAKNLTLKKLPTLTKAKFSISTRTDTTLQASVKYLKAITMCSAFTLDCECDNGSINLVGDVFCPNTKCSGKLCQHKKTIQSLSGSDYQCSQSASVCQMRNIRSEDQKDFFSLSISQKFTFFERI